MKIAFIFNSRSRKINDLAAEIQDHRHPGINSYQLLFTRHKGNAIELAKEISSSVDLIIAVGGDGTLNEVINGVMALDPEKRPGVGLLPKGSANDFARIQGISSDLESLGKVLTNPTFSKVDVGRIGIKSENRNHYFINVADCGFGAEVVRRLEGKVVFRKILSSDLRFALAILRTFFAYKRKEVKIILDNKKVIEGNILTLVAANSRSFGSGLIIAPEARIDDGVLDILVGDISLFGYLSSINNLLKGKKLTLKGVKYLEAAKIEVYGPDGLWTEADGELAGYGDLVIECIPKAIDFLLPIEGNIIH